MIFKVIQQSLEEEKTLQDLGEIGRAQSELQSHHDLVCRLLLEKKKIKKNKQKNKKKNKTTKNKQTLKLNFITVIYEKQ